MITLQITLQDQTVANAIAAASQHGISLDDYIDMRLCADDSFDSETASAPIVKDPIEELAKTLFDAALERTPDGQKYLVEELYKELNLSAWETRSVGNRIKLGKAFVRIVRRQLEGGTQLEDGTQVRVDPCGKTIQNQALYQTVRVG